MYTYRYLKNEIRHLTMEQGVLHVPMQVLRVSYMHVGVQFNMFTTGW